jgi:hypothetical protein
MVPSPDSPTQPTLPTEPTSATGRRGDDDASRKSSRIHVGERARTHGFPGSSETPRTRAAQVQVQCSAVQVQQLSGLQKFSGRRCRCDETRRKVRPQNEPLRHTAHSSGLRHVNSAKKNLNKYH